jgi:hypothetical protein
MPGNDISQPTTIGDSDPTESNVILEDTEVDQAQTGEAPSQLERIGRYRLERPLGRVGSASSILPAMNS